VIVGVGTDIVSVARMQRNLRRHGERFARRVLTPAELEAFSRTARPAHFLAKRFAAKEAVVKALGTGFRDGLRPCHVGVTHDELGRPLIEYRGPAVRLRERLAVGEGHISIADERDYAVAFVTLLSRSP